MRPTAYLAACAALMLAALGAGCNSTTKPHPSGEYSATILLQETGSYATGALVTSPQIAVTAYFVDSTYLVGGSPAGVVAGPLTFWDGSTRPTQTVPVLRAPIPHYAGSVVVGNDSTLQVFFTGDTLTTDGLPVSLASFSVNFAGPPIVTRISEPRPGDELSPASALTVRWSDLPGFDQVEAALISSASPPDSVVARGVNGLDQGFITFGKAQVATLPEGAATLRVTRWRTKPLSVTGLRGGTATVAATVRMPLVMLAPVAPHHGGDGQ